MKIWKTWSNADDRVEFFDDLDWTINFVRMEIKKSDKKDLVFYISSEDMSRDEFLNLLPENK